MSARTVTSIAVGIRAVSGAMWLTRSFLGHDLQEGPADMADHPSEVHPYRVVFTRVGSARPGRIESTDAGVAHREARAIADAGGRAEVQYVASTGPPQTLATYP